MCAWIKDELGPLTPLHFSRFYPLYKMLNHYPTPVSTLERARDLARKAGLQYVYIGNLPGHEAENTYCHHCHKLIIARQGYKIVRWKPIKEQARGWHPDLTLSRSGSTPRSLSFRESGIARNSPAPRFSTSPPSRNGRMFWCTPSNR